MTTRKVLYEWSGEGTNPLPGYDQLSGTGQAGATTRSTTRGNSITNEAGAVITSQTSSGDGFVMIRQWLPSFPEHSRIVVGMRYRNPNADTSLNWVELRANTARNLVTVDAAMRVQSGYNATEQIQYYNTTPGWTDTGMTWIGDNATIIWNELEFAVDINTATYLWMKCGADFVVSEPACETAATTIADSTELQITLAGKNLAVYLYIDALWIHAIEGV